MLWLAIISLMGAEPLPTEVLPSWEFNGRTYQNVKLQTLRESDAILHHEDGLLRVKLSELPEPWKSRYYNPEKAEHMKKMAALKKEYDALIKQIPAEVVKENTCRLIDDRLVNTNQMRHINGRIFKKLPGAFLAHTFSVSSSGDRDFGADIYVLCPDDVYKNLVEDTDFTFFAMKTIKTYDYKNFIGYVTTYNLYDMGKPYVSDVLKKLTAVGLFPLPPELMQK